jgi:hypothetical protein
MEMKREGSTVGTWYTGSEVLGANGAFQNICVQIILSTVHILPHNL